MPHFSKAPFFDASVLRIGDSTPVKVTFLGAETGGHFIGFYTFDSGAFRDIRAVFSNVGPDTLIPNVSSVFLGSRLNGKTPVFFVAENGYALNKGADWFNDAAAGKNGFWKFLTPPEQENAVPALEKGETVWMDPETGISVPAQEARQGTAHPVLVWQTNDGKLFRLKGRLYHSFGFGVYPDLNPDGRRHSVLILEEETSSAVLNFAGAAAENLMAKPMVSLRLQIGERSFAALVRNRVIGGLSLDMDSEQPVLSASVEIPDEFEDTLYLEGFEDQQMLPVAGTTFQIETKDGRMTLKGDACAAVYEALLSRVKVRTDASAPSKSAVTVVFHTDKGDILRKGEVEILSERVKDAAVLSCVTSLPIPVPPPAEKRPRIFEEAAAKTDLNKSDDLPSFLTEPLAALAVKPASLGKTVLITGGAYSAGKSITQMLASRGYNVIVHCHTAAAEAARLVEDVRQAYGVKAAYIRADFSVYEETADLIETVSKTYGTIDVLINNASAFVQDDIAGTAEAWARNTAVNLQAPFILSRDFVRTLPKGKDGVILNLFENALPGEYSSYALCCPALRELTLMTARAFAPRVRANAVAVAKLKEDAYFDEIAHAVCYLMETSLITGQILTLGGESVLAKLPEKKK